MKAGIVKRKKDQVILPISMRKITTMIINKKESR